MYVDSMNDEGLDLERETWRDLESWKFGRFLVCCVSTDLRFDSFSTTVTKKHKSRLWAVSTSTTGKIHLYNLKIYMKGEGSFTNFELPCSRSAVGPQSRKKNSAIIDGA